ncbi:hypothetical protein B0J11DRAFT_588383 [Dendryphion nanum]|uniref:Uncharacterized protein n=1 Tax=Dendryphion nanum TaxID=256645 RepID=A0A9P9EFY9_9PLEO|nr:hypothetical protein B0J11DRAFT_588383 [Dendryphion nanum]
MENRTYSYVTSGSERNLLDQNTPNMPNMPNISSDQPAALEEPSQGLLNDYMEAWLPRPPKNWDPPLPLRDGLSVGFTGLPYPQDWLQSIQSRQPRDPQGPASEIPDAYPQTWPFQSQEPQNPQELEMNHTEDDQLDYLGEHFQHHDAHTRSIGLPSPGYQQVYAMGPYPIQQRGDHQQSTIEDSENGPSYLQGHSINALSVGTTSPHRYHSYTMPNLNEQLPNIQHSTIESQLDLGVELVTEHAVEDTQVDPASDPDLDLALEEDVELQPSQNTPKKRKRGRPRMFKAGEERPIKDFKMLFRVPGNGLQPLTMFSPGNASAIIEAFKAIYTAPQRYRDIYAGIADNCKTYQKGKCVAFHVISRKGRMKTSNGKEHSCDTCTSSGRPCARMEVDPNSGEDVLVFYPRPIPADASGSELSSWV